VSTCKSLRVNGHTTRSVVLQFELVWANETEIMRLRNDFHSLLTADVVQETFKTDVTLTSLEPYTLYTVQVQASNYHSDHRTTLSPANVEYFITKPGSQYSPCRPLSEAVLRGGRGAGGPGPPVRAVASLCPFPPMKLVAR